MKEKAAVKVYSKSVFPRKRVCPVRFCRNSEWIRAENMVAVEKRNQNAFAWIQIHGIIDFLHR